MDFGLLSGVGSIIGGIGSLFGKGKTSDPRSNIHSAAKGAREAAAKYGFNPLTLLQYGSGGFGGTTQGAAPPLASIDMITGGLRDINDVVSGDAERRRQADELKMDLAKLEMEKLRAGIVAIGQTGATVGDTFGRRSVAVGQSDVRSVSPKMSGNSGQWIAGDRDIKVAPVENIPGVIDFENNLTGGSVTVPGSDGDPWGLSELIAAGIVGGPQVAWNWTKRGLKAGYGRYTGNSDYGAWRRANKDAPLDNAVLDAALSYGSGIDLIARRAAVAARSKTL